MLRTASRVDANQALIVRALHGVGASNAFVKGLTMLTEEAKQYLSYLELIGGDILKLAYSTPYQLTAPTPYS